MLPKFKTDLPMSSKYGTHMNHLDTIKVKQSLKKMLEEYRSCRPNLSLRAIAKNAGVNRYFLSKLLDYKESDKIDLDQILTFCRFMKNSENLPNTIKTQIEILQKYLFEKLAINSAHNKTEVILDEDKEADLYNHQNFFILLLASCENGFTKKKIISILGENCKKNLQHLIKTNKIFENKEGKIQLADNCNMLYISHAVLHHHLPSIIRYYDLEHKGKNRNWISITLQGLNKDTIKKAVAIQNECATKLKELIHEKKNWGNNPFFSVICSDTLTDEIEP